MFYLDLALCVCGVFDVNVVCFIYVVGVIGVVGTFFGSWFSLYVGWSKKVFVIAPRPHKVC